MAAHKTEAIALRTYEYLEKDLVVVLFSRDRGQLRGIAKGAKGFESRFRGVFAPLTELEAIFWEKPGRELVVLQDVHVLHSPYRLQTDYNALTRSAYIAEISIEFTEPEVPSDPLFRLLGRLARSQLSDAGGESLVRYFEYWLLRLEGVLPDFFRCIRCGETLSSGAFLIEKLQAICDNCRSPKALTFPLSGEALSFLKLVRRSQPEQIAQLTVGARAHRQVERILTQILENILQKELKSSEFLHRERAHYKHRL